MGLETGTFISDLVSTNPAITDQVAQGANHLQLIKSVLQNTFPVTAKAFPFPTVGATVTGTAAITKSQYNQLILVDTTIAPFTITLPTLTSGDAGWTCSFMKIAGGSNPFFIAPPTGTLASGEYFSLGLARRCIPGAKTDALWTGTSWLLTRVCRVPIGTVLELSVASLPIGYEWPNGQTLSSAATNYPEYFSLNGSSGVTPDKRGRYTAGVDNMGGSTAGRITVAGGNFDGTVLNATGGAQNITVSQANLPAVNFSVSGITVTDAGHSHGLSQLNGLLAYGGGGSQRPLGAGQGTANLGAFSTDTGFANLSVSGSVPSGGSGTHIAQLPPTIMMNCILVVE